MALPLRVWNGSEWINIGVQGGTVLYQNEEPASPQTGMIWIDADSETSVLNDEDYLTLSTASATYATQTNLTDGLASKLPYSYGTATPSTTDSGFLWYDSNSTPAAPKFWDGAAFQALTSGKILQVVRATDSTDRSTTSTSLVDASISVTITPQKVDSALLLFAQVRTELAWSSATEERAEFVLADSSNNTVSGAERLVMGFFNMTSPAGSKNVYDSVHILGYATPATTSSVTYKMRYRTLDASNTISIRNSLNTGQLFAIEVSA